VTDYFTELLILPLLGARSLEVSTSASLNNLWAFVGGGIFKLRISFSVICLLDFRGYLLSDSKIADLVIRAS
jgi:hypothetical protein